MKESVEYLQSQGLSDQAIMDIGSSGNMEMFRMIHNQATAAKRQKESKAREAVRKRIQTKKAKEKPAVNTGYLSKSEQVNAVADLLNSL